MEQLVQELKELGYLKNPRVEEAFLAVDRANFVPQDLKGFAYINEALPIGFGQTISQPLVVAFMLELLNPRRGEKFLDIGSGSGWTTALLGHLAGKEGQVFGIETIPELVKRGQENIASFAELNVRIMEGNGYEGYSSEAPYEGILVSASLQTNELPEAWRSQTKKGGRIAVPIESSIWYLEKKQDGTFEGKEHPGFSFVPFIPPQ